MSRLHHMKEVSLKREELVKASKERSTQQCLDWDIKTEVL
jgi:hypothetical protein